MKRESFILESDIVEFLMVGDNHEDYRYITDEVVDTDLEKGYNLINLVIQRKSDNKYFMGCEILSSGHHSPDDTEFEEVFKVTKTIVTEVYE